MSDDEYGPALPPGIGVKTQRNEKVAGPDLPAHLKRNVAEIEPSDPSSKARGPIGPVLPPHLLTKTLEDDIGPSLPPSGSNEYIGPMLPLHLMKGISEGGNDLPTIGTSVPPGVGIRNETDDVESIGPKLPPQFKNRVKDSKHTAIGPCLPPGMSRKSVPNIGPSLTSKGEDLDSEDDADVIGPLPCEMLKGDVSGITAAEIESRAQQMRDRLEGKEKDEKPVRESWMMELPSAKLSQSIGLQARSFRARAGPDMSDRSAWTDTPADRERKTKEGESIRKRAYSDIQSDREKQVSKDVHKYNKSNRPESLLEMHQKELKKKKTKTEDKPAERIPFDREVDLQVNRFDDAQRKAIIKKSQKLDTRFSHGSTQFL